VRQTVYRLRLIVLIALTTGMRIAEIFGLKWSAVLRREGLIAVRSRLKGGKVPFVPMIPMIPELATEIQRFSRGNRRGWHFSAKAGSEVKLNDLRCC